MTEVEFKGVQIFYHDCCTTEQQAIDHAKKQISNNYASGNVDRLKGICLDHKLECGGNK